MVGCYNSPSAEHLAGVCRDLEKAIEMYDSWAGALLQAALPAVRKAVGAPCALVLQTLGALTAKAATKSA